MKGKMSMIMVSLMLVSGASIAAEMGTGKDNDIPSAAPGESNAESSSVWEQLLEWFDFDTAQ